MSHFKFKLYFKPYRDRGFTEKLRTTIVTLCYSLMKKHFIEISWLLRSICFRITWKSWKNVCYVHSVMFDVHICSMKGLRHDKWISNQSKDMLYLPFIGNKYTYYFQAKKTNQCCVILWRKKNRFYKIQGLFIEKKVWKWCYQLLLWIFYHNLVYWHYFFEFMSRLKYII